MRKDDKNRTENSRKLPKSETILFSIRNRTLNWIHFKNVNKIATKLEKTLKNRIEIKYKIREKSNIVL